MVISSYGPRPSYCQHSLSREYICQRRTRRQRKRQILYQISRLRVGLASAIGSNPFQGSCLKTECTCNPLQELKKLVGKGATPPSFEEWKPTGAVIFGKPVPTSKKKPWVSRVFWKRKKGDKGKEPERIAQNTSSSGIRVGASSRRSTIRHLARTWKC